MRTTYSAIAKEVASRLNQITYDGETLNTTIFIKMCFICV